MFKLFETICIKKGIIQNIEYHQYRYEKSIKKLYNGNSKVFSLQKIIQKNTALISNSPTEIIRCRINYSNIDYEVQFFPYQQKKYRTFRPVICNSIDYSLKYYNRDLLNQLLQQKGDCDEIMIIKNGKVTDCSIGNLIFKKENKWFTPDSPLLAGTQRAKLLNENKIAAIPIFLNNIEKFEEIRLINALNDL